MLVVSPRHLNHQVVVIWPMFRSLAVHVLLLFLNLSSNLSINTTTCSSSTRSRKKNYRQDEVLDQYLWKLTCARPYKLTT